MQSTHAEVTPENDNKYLISGSLDFSTVPNLIRKVTVFLGANTQSQAKGMTFNLSQTTDCNSAGLALLLEIAKQANSRNIKIYFENLPEPLMTIAKAYGVESEIREFCK